MSLESVLQAVVAAGTPAATAIGLLSRKRRLRNEIRENLQLLKDLDESLIHEDFPQVRTWLRGRIALDVAKVAGAQSEAQKKPIPWSSIVLAFLIGAPLGFWTWIIDRDGFVWYSVFPGVIAALMAISIFGLFLNRDKPEEPVNN